jgi:sec-independent protein translocase protein TatB
MFDIAFSELVVVALVALIVVGPERLPKLARRAGRLWGRVQRYVNNVKNDINNDLALAEARKLQDSIRQQVAAAERSVQEAGLTLEQHILQARHNQTTINEQGKLPASPEQSPT